MDDQESDGKKPWLVANFPVELRREITKEAGRLKVTVAEWLLAHFEQHGTAGVAVVHRPVSYHETKLDVKLSNSDLIAIASSPTIQRWLRYHAARELAERMGVELPPIKPPLFRKMVQENIGDRGGEGDGRGKASSAG